MTYNPKIHHRKSIRLKGYDYSQSGLYFVTICCKNKECLFGNICTSENHESTIMLNDAGKIANDCWLQIPEHFPGAILHEHIIMPNHMHGIVELTENDTSGGVDVGAGNFQPLRVNNRLPQKN